MLKDMPELRFLKLVCETVVMFKFVSGLGPVDNLECTYSRVANAWLSQIAVNHMVCQSLGQCSSTSHLHTEEVQSSHSLSSEG